LSEISLIREESCEDTLDLLLGSVVQSDVDISSARSEECRVELFFVVSGHKEDLAFLTSNTIESVKET
jgi:hypothetical protein